MKKVRVGIVGFGFMGRTHAYGYINLPLFYDPAPVEAKITHVCDSRPEAARQGAAMLGAQAVTDFRRITENPEIDIVHVCTPNHMHADVLLSAIAAGKHVYCDKPLTATWAEAERVEAALRSWRGTGQMALQNRFFPSTMRARQVIEEGFLGQVLEFNAAYLHAGSADPNAPLKWKLSAAAGGGVIADLGTHLFDVVHWLLGDFDRLSATTHIAYPTRPSAEDPSKRVPVEAEDSATVRGAWEGEAIYCVSPTAGDLYYSSDGLAFSVIATWLAGWVMNTLLDGSGDLIWLRRSAVDTNPVVRLYNTSGTLLDDITGDLWTVLGHPGGTILFDNMLLVYETGGLAGNPTLIADLHAGSASGTGATDVAISGQAIIFDSEFDVVQVDSGGIAYVRDVAYTTQNGTGTIEPVQSDRAVFDALHYQLRHANDIDDAAGVHHTQSALDALYQPLAAILTALAALADAAGMLTNDGAGVLSWETVATGALDDLTDVTITTPADGEVLTYASGEWINSPAALVGQYRQFVYTYDATTLTFLTDEDGKPLFVLSDLE